MLEQNGFIDENIGESSLILVCHVDDEKSKDLMEEKEDIFEQNSSNDEKEQNDLVGDEEIFEQNSSNEEKIENDPIEEFFEQNSSNDWKEPNDMLEEEEEIFEQNSSNDEVKVDEPEFPPKARSADPMSRGRCCSSSRCCCCCCCCYVSPKSLIAAKSLDRLAIDLSSQSSRALRHISPSPPSGNLDLNIEFDMK